MAMHGKEGQKNVLRSAECGGNIRSAGEIAKRMSVECCSGRHVRQSWRKGNAEADAFGIREPSARQPTAPMRCKWHGGEPPMRA
jgi:hypothetical protein